MKIKTWDITGFGGGYEETCQQMLWNAVRFLLASNKEIETKQLKNVYGIAINEGKDGEAFDKAMMDGVEGATGAMHQCVTNHAIYINKNGYSKWYEELKNHRKGEQPYDFIYPNVFELCEEVKIT